MARAEETQKTEGTGPVKGISGLIVDLSLTLNEMWSHRGLGAEKCRESDLGFHRIILSDAGEQMERGKGGSRKAAAITKPRAGPWTLRLMYLRICPVP